MFAERPAKVSKKSDDVADPKEEEKAAGDPPCRGSDCGTDKDSEGAPKEEDTEQNGDAAPKAETKEEESDGSKAEDAPDDTAPPSDAAPTAGEAPAATDTAASGISGLPAGVPSGLPPDAPVDPTQAATITNPDSVVEERAELDKDLVGRVIGKGGEMIRDLQVSVLCIMKSSTNH